MIAVAAPKPPPLLQPCTTLSTVNRRAFPNLPPTMPINSLVGPPERNLLFPATSQLFYVSPAIALRIECSAMSSGFHVDAGPITIDVQLDDSGIRFERATLGRNHIESIPWGRITGATLVRPAKEDV